MTVSLANISKSYAKRCLFEDLTLQIGHKARIGLIGRNGCGKSTLLKIIMKQQSADSGTISYSPGCHVNYLSQEPRITPTLTLEEEMQSVFSVINDLQTQEADVLEKLEHSASATEAEQFKWLQRLDTIHQDMQRLEAHNMDARIGRIVGGLGFTLADYQRKTGEFSGGWQMRINLAKVLLEGADILLLDEPTNHLDLGACEWLEGFLSDYPGGILLVSHDRRFLDNITTSIAELEHNKLRLWPGNYTAYLQQKAEAAENLTSAFHRQQKDLAKQTAFVERFRASATKSTQAKSREKQLNKIERIELPESASRAMGMRFPPPAPSGKDVFQVKNISKAFGDKPILTDVNATFERDHRIFLLGANGCGKTTLLRLILGQETPDTGDIKLGHNATLGYFSQSQLATLDPKLSVFTTLEQARPDLTNTELRTHLGHFLFTGDDVFKPVSTFSGGEKSKLALAKLVLSGSNTLLLDEPTNHMDIPSKDVMADALQQFKGSILCISHDRHFIQALATEIWEIHNGQLIVYRGNYKYYRQNRETRQKKLSASMKTAPSKPKKPLPDLTIEQKNEAFKAKKEVEKQYKSIEKEILKTETKLAALESQLNDPTIQQDAVKLLEASQAFETKQNELSKLNTQWATLLEQLEELTATIS